MPAYTVELPTDIDAFRFWFRMEFSSSLKRRGFETVPLAAVAEIADTRDYFIYTEEKNGQNLSDVHKYSGAYIVRQNHDGLDSLDGLAVIVYRAYRKDRVILSIIQGPPVAKSRIGVLPGATDREVIDALQDWLTVIFGKTQLREIPTDETGYTSLIPATIQVQRGPNVGTDSKVRETHRNRRKGKSWQWIRRECKGCADRETYLLHCLRVTGEEPILHVRKDRNVRI